MARNLTKARGLIAELTSLARPAIFAFVAPPLLFWGVSNCQASELPPKRLPVLRTARAVHGLTPDQASLGYPVRIRGTVTFFDPYQVGHRALFVADETGDVFVAPGHLATPGLHAGSRVEVSGVTDPGGYSPIVASSAIRILPGSNPLPTPRASTVSTLLTGSEDSQWVALRGIVRSAQLDGMHDVITLATNDGTITATTDKEDGANYSALIDSEVILRGVAAPLVNSRRQLTGMRLLFPGMKTLSIIAPAAPDPFLLPVRSLSSLLQYSPYPASSHRVHVRGRVTLSWPGQTVCIVDDSTGLCIQTADTTALSEGDLIDVAGFLGREASLPAISAATLRLEGNGRPVRPVTISPADAFKDGTTTAGTVSHASHIDVAKANSFNTDHNGELVRAQGTLVGRNHGLNGSTFVLSSEGVLFTVVPPATATEIDKQLESSLVDGSTIMVTGVFVGKVDELQTTRQEGIARLESFQILLRSPKDVVILSVPSWWNSRHSLEVLGLLVFALAAILAWVVLLRRQVHRQTGIIRQSEERFRHLAEHDGLTGLPVRRVLMERLELALHEIQRQPASLALLMVDVDSFKQLNDSFGHAVGDQVLCTIANRLQESVRLTDTVARMGGDEFTVLLSGLRHEREAQKIASQVVSNVCAPIVIDGRTVEVSVSVGVATCPEDGGDVETLLRNSDAALYQAKARGRNCYQIYSADTVPFLFTSRFSTNPT